MKSRNFAHLPGLDHLRGVAAALIMLYHGRQLFGHYLKTGGEGFSPLQEWTFSLNPLIALVAEGHVSVTLFIVLSGFVFTYGCLGKGVAYGDFLVNRAWRVVPLAVLLTVFGIYVYPGSYNVLAFLQLLLLQTAALPGRLDNPFTGMLWTLCVEMQFYLVFPFLLRCYERRGVFFPVMLIAAFTVMRGLAFLLTGTLRDTTYFSIVGRIDQFMIGMLAGAAYNHFPAVRKHTSVLFLAAVAVALGYVTLLNKSGGWPVEGMFWIVWPWVEGLVCGLLLLTYLSFSAFVPAFVGRVLTAMGTVSYSTYLVHYPILVALIHARLVIRLPANAPDPALLNTVLLLVPLTYAVSTVTYLGIERPFFQFRRKYVGTPAVELTPTRSATG